MKRKPIRGTRLLGVLQHACIKLEQHGLWTAIRFVVARTIQWATGFIWKVRLVWYWLWSPLVSEEDRFARDAACETCESREVAKSPSGFFRWAVLGYDLSPGGAYCGACNCWDWFLALLKRKNGREGHICPLGKHPGQTPVPQRLAQAITSQQPGGCKGCGSKKTNGTTTVAARAKVPAALEHTELPALSRS